jgi:hypothetical protein
VEIKRHHYPFPNLLAIDGIETTVGMSLYTSLRRAPFWATVSCAI